MTTHQTKLDPFSADHEVGMAIHGLFSALAYVSEMQRKHPWLVAYEQHELAKAQAELGRILGMAEAAQ